MIKYLLRALAVAVALTVAVFIWNAAIDDGQSRKQEAIAAIVRMHHLYDSTKARSTRNRARQAQATQRAFDAVAIANAARDTGQRRDTLPPPDTTQPPPYTNPLALHWYQSSLHWYDQARLNKIEADSLRRGFDHIQQAYLLARLDAQWWEATATEMDDGLNFVRSALEAPECRIAFFNCPSRKVVAIVSGVAGIAIGITAVTVVSHIR